MTEEEYFRKNYPDSCYGDKPLSPHWDFFQDGVEFGERQSEKRIAELEKENAGLKKESDFYHAEKGKYKSAFLKEVLEKNKINKQLSKAKEIIRMVIDSYNHKERFSFEKDLMKAEQFLKGGN